MVILFNGHFLILELLLVLAHHLFIVVLVRLCLLFLGTAFLVRPGIVVFLDRIGLLFLGTVFVVRLGLLFLGFVCFL